MFREIPLTQGKVAIVDSCDYEMLMQWKWYAHCDHSTGRFYAARQVGLGNKKQRYLSMHRFLMGEPKNLKIDHKDRDGLHNYRSNLRVATDKQNGWNKGIQSNNTSGYFGVHQRKATGRWQAYIVIDRKHIHLGFYATAEEAARAYDRAARVYRDEFTTLNFPDKAAA
jgi:hypothetical protein